jgi:hypothetical protein
MAIWSIAGQRKKCSDMVEEASDIAKSASASVLNTELFEPGSSNPARVCNGNNQSFAHLTININAHP